MNKKILLTILMVVLVGAGSFYAGMTYGKTKNSFVNKNGNSQRIGAPGDQGNNQMNESRRMGQGGGFINGTILSKDDKSITLKLNDSGSKIIFLSDSTKITKSATGTATDLNISSNVMVNGTTNSDGSVTAQNIQIR
jgi:hypothetical protein